MNTQNEIYYLYQNEKELNSTGVHEIEIYKANLESIQVYKEKGWQVVGSIRSDLDPGELYAGLTATLDEALRDAENSLDIIWKYIREWNDRDMERKYK